MPSVERVDDDAPPKGYGVLGRSRTGGGYGVVGASDSGDGVRGLSNRGYGVFGQSSSLLPLLLLQLLLLSTESILQPKLHQWL